jgi:predicted CXXCH cytochrome family protein
MKSRLLVRLVALLAVLAAAAAIALHAVREREAPRPPDRLVPLVWQTARETPMHELHVGTKKIACGDCHTGNEAEGGQPPATVASCPKCHEHENALGHGKSSSPAHASGPSCLSCHVFGANKPVATCNECHADGKRAEGAPDLRHHATHEADCRSCHTIHGPERTLASDCTSCHSGIGAKHGSLVVEPTDAGAAHATACTACHAPHQGKTEALATCQGCHVRPKVASHEACTTCHEPHRARREEVRPCAGCHADHRGASTVAGHAACTGCHDPHRPAEDPASRCTKCHATTTASHPATSDGKTCTGCHSPHGDRTAPAHGGLARAPCTSCHAELAGGAARSVTHGSRHDQKVDCTQCHRPHDFALGSAGTGLCASCHAEKTAAVRDRPGHAACNACHGEPHRPTPKPTCNACHGKEQLSAPPGHQACASCHDVHSGRLAMTSCTSCHEHEPKAKAQHGSLAGGCQTCHRAHGPNGVAQPPACTTCHGARPANGAPAPQGLHSRPDHAVCASCHTSHGPAKADRATCTGTCHADRRAHQPDATACNGCHLFRQ